MIDMAFMSTIDNAEVLETFCKAERHLKQHDRILCSVSGGSDSDIVIDILSHCEGWPKVRFVFFDTGVEFEATKRHLENLEKRYNIKIERVKAEMPIPLVVKKYGQPLISKNTSENIHRLQGKNFTWTTAPYEDVIAQFPNAKTSVKWWCNQYIAEKRKTSPELPFKTSIYDIAQIRGLKEFIIKNPITFAVSNKCCYYTKKRSSYVWEKSNAIDLKILGIRKVEGGGTGKQL